MTNYENNAFFWQKVDSLYLSGSRRLIKKKGEQHDTYKNLVYPLDYARIEDMKSVSDHGVAVYLGSDNRNKVSGLIVAADILEKELDVKVLAGCTDEEIEDVLRYLNQTEFQKTILIKRGNEVPDWAQGDN
jgi:inorganic pyrophosphatase